MIKKAFLIGLIILGIIFIYILVPWGIMGIGLLMGSAPKEPIYLYGEFPFELQYEINGEIKTITDTLVCEYDGIGINEASGKYRKWKSYLLSDKGSNKIVLIQINHNEMLYYDPGLPNFYMGDCSYAFKYDFPNARYFKKNEINSGYQEGVISAKDLYDNYNIKLIKWEPSSPIHNSFE